MQLGGNGGTFIAPTGFGKTRVVLNIIKALNLRSIIICVPTKRLKEQWEAQVGSNVQVFVVNTLAVSHLTCDLLVLDEAHRYGTKFFRGSFENTRYKKLLCVTATIERKDNLQRHLLKRAPIFDRVTVKECLDNGWVNNYVVYNVGLTLYPDEQEILDNANSKFEYYSEKLGGKVEAWANATLYIKKEYWENLINDATDKVSAQIPGSKAQIDALVELDTIKKIRPDLTAWSIQYLRAVKIRKTLLYNARQKLEYTEKLLKKYTDRKSIVFSQTTKFADDLHKRVGDSSVTIHSKMTDKQCEKALEAFIDDSTNVRVICSVKSLNEGLDVPDCTLGVCSSGDSSRIGGIQMLGRVIRLNATQKKSIFVNLYILDSQDFIWVKNRISDIPSDRVIWIRR